MPKIVPRDIKLLIVDMDNTLCDTHHTLSIPQWRRVETALVKAGKPEHAKAFRKAFGKFSFVKTLESLKMTKEEQRFCVKVYDDVDIRELRLFSDASFILSLNKKIVKKVLVTRGEPRLQERKIRQLGIRKYFDKVYPVHTFETKTDAFKEAMEYFGVKPHECLVIGDRIEEEIKDANKLGIPSVLVRRPDWPIHKGIAKPDRTVRSLRSVAKLFS